jgi:hypothetical protein
VIAPRYWTAMSVLRGVVNPPFDLMGSRQPRVHALIKEAESEAQATEASSEKGSLPSPGS